MNSNKDTVRIDETGGTSKAIDAGAIYEGGGILPIVTSDLVGNTIAIKQLINDRNLSHGHLREAERQLAKREAEIEYLKTSPFISIINLIITAIGTLIAGIGINQITASPPLVVGKLNIYAGAALIILGGIANTLYPFARGWFNLEPRKK